MAAKQNSPLLPTKRKPESKYVDLAVEMQYRANTIGEKEEMNATYFIYQTGHVQGPYTVYELLGKCVRNEIHLKSEKILFCPTSLTNNYSNQKNVTMWHTLQQLKDTGSTNHDKLYSALHPLQQMERIIHHPPVPHNKLLTDRKHTFGISFHQTIHILSVLLSKTLFIFISLHFIIPFILCTFTYCILHIFCCSQKTLSLFSPYRLCVFIAHTLMVKNIRRHNNNKQLTSADDLSSIDFVKLQNNKFKDRHYVSTFIGFVCTPLTIIVVLNHYKNTYYKNTNVWMIAYGFWCLFFIIDYFCINLNLWYTHLTKLIVGIHVTNVHKQDLLLILCALSATLPAVVFGYVANYILDEKLTLTCTADTVSEICIENQCCHIVSSHEVNVGNMIGLFGLLRLLSWMVMKADMTIFDTIEPLEPEEK